MVRRTYALRTLAIAALVAVCGPVGTAQQRSDPPEATWPDWRGPHYTGVALTAAPERWDDSTNVAWKVEIPGRGHSSPTVWQDRIFVTTAVPTGRTERPAGAEIGRFGGGTAAWEEQRFEVMALDRESGKMLWRRVAAIAVPHEGYHQQYGSFASPSPITDGQRVYASFGSRGVFVYDMDGTLLWSKSPGIRMRMFNQFGEGAGPVVDDGRLILLYDHEGDSFITMVDAATGEDIWRVAREERTNWSTPIVIEHDGTKQIVVAATDRVRSYEFETGRLIWQTSGLGLNTIPRPVHHGNLVLVMSGFISPALLAIELGHEGDLTGTEAIVWTINRGTSYTASPVLHDGRLYFVTDSGIVSCLDATTGEPVFTQTRLPRPYSLKSSPVAAGERLYFATEDGDVVVATLGESFEVIATNTLADQSFVATPAVADGDLYLRSRTHLFRISENR